IWARSPEGSSLCSMHTAPQLSRRLSPPPSARMPPILPPCVTSLIGTKPIPVTLPDDPRVRSLTVRPHNLADYEHLTPKEKRDECADASSQPTTETSPAEHHDTDVQGGGTAAR